MRVQVSHLVGDDVVALHIYDFVTFTIRQKFWEANRSEYDNLAEIKLMIKERIRESL